MLFLFLTILYYTITEDNARAVIGQYLLIIIPVNHMENVVIIYKQCTTHFYGLLAQLTTRDVGRTREEIVSHDPKASDFQTFRVLFQHPK